MPYIELETRFALSEREGWRDACEQWVNNRRSKDSRKVCQPKSRLLDLSRLHSTCTTADPKRFRGFYVFYVSSGTLSARDDVRQPVLFAQLWIRS